MQNKENKIKQFLYIHIFCEVQKAILTVKPFFTDRFNLLPQATHQAVPAQADTYVGSATHLTVF